MGAWAFRKCPGCYTAAPMRRWLLILLLVFLPLQFTWAAAASYCRHEGGVAAARHVGHHEHQHKAPEAHGGASQADAAKAGGVDTDCSACHAGCVPAMPISAALPLVPGESSFAAPRVRALRGGPSDLPERPNWPVSA